MNEISNSIGFGVEHLSCGGTLASALYDFCPCFHAHTIFNLNGNPVFELRLFYPQDGYFTGDDTSTWSFDPATLERTYSAAQHWVDIFKVIPGQNPAIINVGTEDEENASALSSAAKEQNGAGALIDAALNNGELNPVNFINGARGVIWIGKMDWDWEHLCVITTDPPPKIDMTSTLIHEIAHALGISATVDAEQEGALVDAKFGCVLDACTTHLIDGNGKAAAPDQTIICNCCEPADAGADVFDVSAGWADFAGLMFRRCSTEPCPEFHCVLIQIYGLAFWISLFRIQNSAIAL